MMRNSNRVLSKWSSRAPGRHRNESRLVDEPTQKTSLSSKLGYRQERRGEGGGRRRGEEEREGGQREPKESKGDLREYILRINLTSKYRSTADLLELSTL